MSHLIWQRSKVAMKQNNLLASLRLKVCYRLENRPQKCVCLSLTIRSAESRHNAEYKPARSPSPPSPAFNVESNGLQASARPNAWMAENKFTQTAMRGMDDANRRQKNHLIYFSPGPPMSNPLCHAGRMKKNPCGCLVPVSIFLARGSSSSPLSAARGL